MVTTAVRSKGNAKQNRHGHQPDGTAGAGLDHALLNALPDAVLLFDAQERLAGANAAFRRLFPGLDEVLDEPVQADFLFAAMSVDLVPASIQGSPALLDERLARLREPGQPWRQLLASGRIIEIEDRVVAGGGRLSCYRDVTRHASEFSMLSQRLAAVETMQDGIIITDATGDLLYMNQSLAGLLGFSEAATLTGRPWLQFLTRFSARRLRTEIMPALPNTRHWRGEVDGMTAPGSEIPLELSMTQLEEGGAIIVVRSLVEQKAQARERARLQEQFFEAQKMEALGTLAGGIAHDFNNILSCIMGYASFLREDLPPDETGAGYASNIILAAERARALVGQILSFSRRAPTERAVFAPAKVMTETAGLLRATLSPRVKLDLTLPESEAQTLGDATQIGQVLMNLAVNARDALPESGGTIAMSLSVREAPSAPLPKKAGRGIASITIGDAANPLDGSGKWLAMTVRDTGGGIPKETLSRIFDPFFTTKGEHGGSGLGLAAVHGIVLEHGGALTVTSSTGTSSTDQGSEFTVLLPLAGDTAEKQAIPPDRTS